MADIITRRLTPDVLDPELIKLAAPIARQWEAAVLRVAASRVDSTIKLSTAADAPEAILAARFREVATARPQAAQRSGERAAAQLKAPATARRFAVPDGPPPSGDDLLRIVDRQYAALGMSRITVRPSRIPARPRPITLDLHRVQCIDETNAPWPIGERGKDEISMSGLTIDESAVTGKIDPFRVGSFDDRTVKNLSPPRRLVSYAGGGTTYPKHYFTTLLLFEVDQGDLSETMESVLRKFAAAVAAKLGAAGGPVLGPVIGWLLNWFAGKLVDLLIRWWEDDAFKPVTLEVIVPEPSAPLSSGRANVHFTGPGDYRAVCHWTIAPFTIAGVEGGVLSPVNA